MVKVTSSKTVSFPLRLLGTDGRNINDIYRFTGQNSRMDIVKLSLESGHIAPTAPDTLGENQSFILLKFRPIKNTFGNVEITNRLVDSQAIFICLETPN
jgi:hypothetical protein